MHVAVRGGLLQSLGRQEDAIQATLRAIEMDPPATAFMLRTLCGSRLLLGLYAEALADCERTPTQQIWFEDQMLLAAVYAHLGDLKKAAIARAEYLRQQPGATIENNLYLRASDVPAFRQQVEAHLLSGLRKAGVPER
jgi:tetratricopeptide (TPR) repeat protein